MWIQIPLWVLILWLIASAIVLTWLCSEIALWTERRREQTSQTNPAGMHQPTHVRVIEE